MQPTVSVIVPVYHVEKSLRRCLESILAQDFADFELILINDGGNAEETAICEEYAAKDSRIVYLFQENRGLSAARNAGLDIARGEWILFADSDDYVAPDFISKPLETVRRTGADIAIFDYRYADADGHPGQLHRCGLPEGTYTGYEALTADAEGKIQPNVWHRIYKREIWRDLRFPPGENQKS